MEAKEYLINSLTISLAEYANLPLKDLQKVIRGELHNYSVIKLEECLPSAGDGSTTVFYLKKFAEAKIAVGMKPATLYQYNLAVKQLCESEGLQLNMITGENIRHFMAAMRMQGFKNTTIRNKYMLLSSVFQFLRRSKYVSFNPCEEVEAPRNNPVIKNRYQIKKLKI